MQQWLCLSWASDEFGQKAKNETKQNETKQQ